MASKVPSKVLSQSAVSKTVRQYKVGAMAIALGGLAVLITAARSVVTIPTGMVGVVETLGKTSATPLSPGIHFLGPTASVTHFSTRLKDIKERIEVTSKDGLAFELDVSLQYRLNPQQAAVIYEQIGPDEQEIIIARFRSIVREVTAQYPVEAVYSSKRREVATQLRARMGEQLAPLGFAVEETLLREVILPESLQAAVEEKLKAEQESQQMAFVLERERQEAERKRIEAQGTADAQRIITEGMTDQMLQLRAIEATEALAASPNTKVLIVDGGSGGLPISFRLDDSDPRVTP
ncbi:MAG: prohibitin family protein [Synechococcales bacterium]|nr:prohibitin family protein [Synechococcales bacterium]